MKRFLILGILAMMLLSVMSIYVHAAADPTLTVAVENIPGTSVTYTSPDLANAKYNVSIYASSNNPAVQNCTLSVGSSYTTNSTSIINGTIGIANGKYRSTGSHQNYNTSPNQTKVNFTLRMGKELEDSNDYVFTATCYRSGSTTAITGTSSAITIDNGAPITPTTLLPTTATTDKDGTVTFSAVVRGNSTTGCVLTFSSEGKLAASKTMDHSGDSCSISNVKLADSGSGYKWGILATDRTNETLSSYSTLYVSTPNLAAKAALIQQLTQEQQQASQKTSTIVWIILAIVVIYILTKKKKR